MNSMRQLAANLDTGQTRQLREEDLIGPTVTNAKYAELSNLGKSLVLSERVRELVPFSKKDGNFVLSGIPDAAAVRTLAEETANMWPRGADTASIFAGSKGGHNALYWGRHYPSGIRRAITRASLYADRIYVLNPFLDSFVFHPEHSPLVKPDAWTGTFAANAAFVSALHPWIAAGIVELVPNPGIVNFKLGAALMSRARDQMIELGAAHKAYADRHFIAATAESFLYMTDEDRERVIDNMGGIATEDRKELAKVVKNLRELDPDVSAVVERNSGDLIRTGTGANFPAVQLIAESLSASVISDHPMSIDRLRMSAQKNATVSQVLSDSFQSLDFAFLNDVPADIAIDVRQRNGLVRFRRYLQDVAALTSAVGASATYEDRVRTCTERLGDEYEAYRKELAGTDDKLARDSFLTIPGLALATSVLTGKLDPVTIGSTCLTGLVKSLFDAWTKRKSHASKPLGVMLKVEAAAN